MQKNRLTYIYIFCLLVLLVFNNSCSDRPSNALDEKTMVALLVDMELAEAYTNTQPGNSNQQKFDIGKQVLEAHGVSEESLDTTLAWYGRNMDEYTALFDKVDAEILKRKKKYVVIPKETLSLSDNIWPYSTHVVISQMSGYEALTFSFPNEDIEKGEIIKISFSLPNPAIIKGTFGVEYQDGEGEATSNTFTNRRKVELELQTDSAKKVTRLFGSMLLKDSKTLPLFIDSISIITESIDSLNYRSKKRSQKAFGMLLPQKKPEIKSQLDSLTSSSEEISIGATHEIEKNASGRSKEQFESVPSIPNPRVPKHRNTTDEFEKSEKNP